MGPRGPPGASGPPVSTVNINQYKDFFHTYQITK